LLFLTRWAVVVVLSVVTNLAGFVNTFRDLQSTGEQLHQSWRPNNNPGYSACGRRGVEMTEGKVIRIS
jgi:hypothetical protein